MRKKGLHLAALIVIAAFLLLDGGQNVYAADTKTMYVAATLLNVRESASTHSKIVTRLKKNTPVTFYQETGSWGKIRANDRTGWVSSIDLTSKRPMTSKIMYLTSNTLLKASASSRGRTLSSLKKGSSITVYSTGSGSYQKAKSSNHIGWILKSKVDNEKTVPSTKTESVNFKIIPEKDSSLEKGKTVVSRLGKKGKKVTFYETIYKNGKAITSKAIYSKVISQPVDQITKVGTKIMASPTSLSPLPEMTPFFIVPASIQSITYGNNNYYVTTLTSDNRTVVYKYDELGHELGHTNVLPIKHGAAISINPTSGHLFITNGGGTNPTKVYEVDFNTQKILSILDFSRLGNSGLSAMDQGTGNLWMETAPNDQGPATFSYCDLNGNVLNQFTIPNQGVPQGIDYKNGLIYYYTDNKITVISTTGQILRSLDVHFPGESEGIVVLPDGRIVVGFNVLDSKTKQHEGHFYFIKGFK